MLIARSTAEPTEARAVPARRSRACWRRHSRHEIRIEPLRAPQRLAPWTYALSVDIVDSDGDELATGRLVLLYDPDGAEAWDGQLRLVAFASAELEADIANDPVAARGRAGAG